MDAEIEKRLIPVDLNYDEDYDSWEFQSELGKYNFLANKDSVRSLLFKIKAKDTDTMPNSSKGKTYAEMVDSSMKKGTYRVYVWKSKHPASIDHVRELLNKEG